MGQAKQRKRLGTWEEDDRILRERAAARRMKMTPSYSKKHAVPMPVDEYEKWIERFLGKTLARDQVTNWTESTAETRAMSEKFRSLSYSKRAHRRLPGVEHRIENANQIFEENNVVRLVHAGSK